MNRVAPSRLGHFRVFRHTRRLFFDRLPRDKPLHAHSRPPPPWRPGFDSLKKNAFRNLREILSNCFCRLEACPPFELPLDGRPRVAADLFPPRRPSLSRVH